MAAVAAVSLSFFLLILRCLASDISASKPWDGSPVAGVNQRDIQWGYDYLAASNGSAPPRRSAREGNSHTASFCQTWVDPPILTGNIVKNPNFRPRTGGWYTFGGGSLNIKGGYGEAGNRQSTFQGPAQNLPVLTQGDYEYVAWVKLGSGTNQVTETTLKTADGAYLCVATVIAKPHCWTKVMGGFTMTKRQSGTIFTQGPSAGVNILVASVSVVKIDQAAWRRAQRARIDAVRKRPVQLQLVDGRGRPVQGLLLVDQLTSDFPFGGGLSGAITVSKKFQNWFKARFNWAVFQNEMKWYYTEYRQGSMNYRDADKMLAWCKSNNIKVRGHNIFWEYSQIVQGWVKALGDSALRLAMQKRLASVVSRYKGHLQHWDVDNEPLHGQYYKNRLGSSIQPWMYAATNKIDPNVKLFVNDFNTVEQCGDTKALPESFLIKVWGLQLKGAPVHGLGVESHFGETKPQAVRIKHDLDALGLAGLPVFITELDVNVKDPIVQANNFEIMMREAFAHPAVKGIVLWETAQPPCNVWNYFDPARCKECTLCLTDHNWNDRPIGKRYVRLRKEWSTHVWRKTDRLGRLNFRGFFGIYRAKITVNGRQIVRKFYVREGSSTVTIKIAV